MKKIYMDQAATSFPKAPGVIEAMVEFMTQVGTNINRGSYENAYETAGVVYETREQLCKLFDFGPIEDKAKNVIFTPNITYALNFIIKGYLKSGDHVLVSSMEHNALMRPLVQLQKDRGITFDRIPCTKEGELQVEVIEALIQKNTKAIIMTHGSNLCGTLMPIKEVGAIAHNHGIKFIVDSAQTAGTFPISMKDMHIDALAFTGHKGLLGPQGIGGFLITDEMADEMTPLITGGTGSISDTEETPTFLPDKFEAGTLNLPGIIGLHRSLKYLEEVGIDKIREKELKLTQQFIDGVSNIEGIRIIGKTTCKDRSSVVSLQTTNLDEAILAFRLDQEYQIMTRVGMHCAPNAHKTLGTFPEGTIRFSFGYSNTEEEVEYAIKAIEGICIQNQN
ncbi:aminotransferase class V-fold PLP-dependent enzyme [Anaerocolumna aminovalerica]|jgi:cysteine desulfurase family protein|uniref:cysteine desulfurase n=1 Tax=Anaerocolumna aminovalerica TaxID=1527 RepID=A0A1I5E5N7_9FIRM|nr:aminotransferase class V-fold PLP-dependent enzyme [Anaerocolumna aminovalerica]MDU6263387.1 aminotransferase class V-fold PLP-dependent enzyme [Anaerocolumna aminovalerica]SFO06737.1 cysteine desulfurase family protein [Anaerocolumna aminovalerica]